MIPAQIWDGFRAGAARRLRQRERLGELRARWTGWMASAEAWLVELDRRRAAFVDRERDTATAARLTKTATARASADRARDDLLAAETVYGAEAAAVRDAIGSLRRLIDDTRMAASETDVDAAVDLLEELDAPALPHVWSPGETERVRAQAARIRESEG